MHLLAAVLAIALFSSPSPLAPDAALDLCVPQLQLARPAACPPMGPGDYAVQLAAAGFKLAPGQMGEQIVVSGLDLAALQPGAQFQLGATAVVEVHDHRSGCERFEHIQGHSPKEAAGRLGVMAKVVIAGPIAVGDPVRLLTAETA